MKYNFKPIKFEIHSVFIILLLTLFAFVYPGYYVLTSDQKIYIPQMLNRLDQDLSDNDILYQFNQTDYTFYDETVGLVQSVLSTDLYITMFILAFCFRFIYYYAIFRIVYYFTNNRNLSLLSPLLFLTGSTVFGTQTLTIDHELHPRTMALAFYLSAFWLYTANQKVVASLIIAIGGMLHMITIIPIYLFIFIDSAEKFIHKKLSTMRALIILSIPVVITLLNISEWSVRESSSLFTHTDSLWRSIIVERDNYVFLRSWDMALGYIHFVTASIMALVLLSNYRLSIKPQSSRRLIILLIVPFFLSGVYFVCAEIFGYGVSLQLYRSMFIWKAVLAVGFLRFAHDSILHIKNRLLQFSIIGILVSIILQEYVLFIFLPSFFLLWLEHISSVKYSWVQNMVKAIKSIRLRNSLYVLLIILLSAAFCMFSYRMDNFLGKDLFLVLSITFIATIIITGHKSVLDNLRKLHVQVLFGILMILIILSRTQVYPALAKDPSFLEMCHWIQSNTAKSDVFLTEPYTPVSESVRVFCKRPIYYSYKDGAQVALDREYALLWNERHSIIESMRNKSISEALYELRGETIRYVIFQKPVYSPILVQVFMNTEEDEKYYVYQIYEETE